MMVCHAVAGAEKARKFLLEKGFPEKFADKVSSCIKAHRFRSSNPPVIIEEKILFDSDKIDATGTLGIARTIFYKGQTGEPLYSRNSMGEVSDGSEDTTPSFFQEYKYKIEFRQYLSLQPLPVLIWFYPFILFKDSPKVIHIAVPHHLADFEQL